MRIEHIDLCGFGTWIDRRWDLKPGINLLVLPNEAGKSTLFRALFTLLYGGQWLGTGAKRSSRMFWLEGDQPWQSASQYGGSVAYCVRGHRYRITRDLALGTVQVEDSTTGTEITQQFSKRARTVRYVLDEQIGLSPEAFANMALWTTSMDSRGGRGSTTQRRWYAQGSLSLIQQFSQLLGTENVESVLQKLKSSYQALGTVASPKKPLGHAYAQEKDIRDRLEALQGSRHGWIVRQKELAQVKSACQAATFQRKKMEEKIEFFAQKARGIRTEKEQRVRWLADKPDPFLDESLYCNLQEKRRQFLQAEQRIQEILSTCPFPRVFSGTLQENEREQWTTRTRMLHEDRIRWDHIRQARCEFQERKNHWEEVRRGVRNRWLFGLFFLAICGTILFFLEFPSSGPASSYWVRVFPILLLLLGGMVGLRRSLRRYREELLVCQQGQEQLRTEEKVFVQRWGIEDNVQLHNLAEEWHYFSVALDQALYQKQEAELELRTLTASYGEDPHVWQDLRTQAIHWEQQEPERGGRGNSLPLSCIGMDPPSPMRESIVRNLLSMAKAKERYWVWQGARLEGDLSVRIQTTEALPQVFAEWSRARDHLQALLREHRALQIALETLQDVAKREQPDVAQSLVPYAREWLGKITSQRYTGWRMDAQRGFASQVRLQSTGRWVPEELLSVGTLDQVWLSLRFAFLCFWRDRMGISLPLFLDDSLAHYDEWRLQRVLTLLGECALNHQILLASCQRREQDGLDQHGITYHCLL
ncbi:ATP-binding protein [Pasteuria penetrans]|uniref:ATP-binding protein n=1 Tax=Pasteuria penetrans TaxID=86005 RepID=UPI000F9B026A|nr:AAA family ATPase [Pasteuria penetrans]